ncbi:MAG: N-6 DNA methylase [Acidobacteria bacterium]|nr:N-6 DNA methylase [Acidobacteriota bacterium]
MSRAISRDRVNRSDKDQVTNETLKDIEKLEADLWSAADNLRANSKLTSSDYFMPVLGIIFLRHAANRFEAAQRQIEADQANGKMPKRRVLPADYIARRSLYLPERARYDWIMQQAAVGGADLPRLVMEAMTAIEAGFEPLLGVLPKDYGIFESKVLEDLMRLFNSAQIKKATGDVFGRIYEYFLAEFSIQKAHDNGEFFTPSSIVQTIVNVIEPDHGTVFDPACGSGGMFVQSSHFIEHEGGDTAKKVVFYGQEKNRDTIRIAKMNLAVHGLEGKIAEAITYYQDEHSLAGKCDFLMANPPFNVDLVDAERIKGDPRLTFGLPGVNKQKKVGNGNYLWISYFWSYLSGKGRAGFVMSSQASSAGHGEKEVRKKIVETGDVDVMVSIRPNFFYTRTVPCELWFFDRGKPAERKGKVLMLDARNIYRKVTRKICDFSPEQMQNLAAVVWLHRGERKRFLALVKDYLGRVCAESVAVPGRLATFETTLAELREHFERLTAAADHAGLDADRKQSVSGTVTELREATSLYESDAKKLLATLHGFTQKNARSLPTENDMQHAVRRAFDHIADAIRGLIKQVDLLCKLAARVADQGTELATHEAVSAVYDRRAAYRLVKQLDEERRAAVEQLKQVIYFHRQAAWLQDRFPKAELQAVPGLVKLVDHKEIEASDWSLTPGRYVGVAPAEEDGDFDFEQTMRDIHTELADLNKEAAELAAKIQKNIEELAV